MRSFNVCHGFGALALALLIASCGGPAATPVTPGQPPAPPGGLPSLPAPAELLKLPATLDEQRTTYGSNYASSLPSKGVTANPFSYADYAPNWDPAAPGGPDQLAYAIYQFGGYDTYTGSARLFTGWEQVDPARVWLALANFDTGRWDWYNSPADLEVELPGMAPYVAPDGRVFLIVLLLGTDAARLNWLVVGDPLVDAYLYADLPGDQLQRLAPLTVNFDASGSLILGGSSASYAMDYDGDGTYDENSTSPLFSHTYPAGQFDATLRITDNFGQSDTAVYPIHVLNPANQGPSASFTPLIVTNTAPLTVDFDASGCMDPDGQVVQYEWDFDGDTLKDFTSTTPQASYTFCEEGTHDVKLTVTDNDLAKAEAYSQVICTNGWRDYVVEAGVPGVPNEISVAVQGVGASARACVAYVKGGASELHFVRSNDNLGMTWAAPVTADPGTADYYPAGAVSLQIESLTQAPIIAYGTYGNNGNPESVSFRRANSVMGTSWGAKVEVSTGQGAGESCRLLQSGGKLIIATVIRRGLPGTSSLRAYTSTDSLGSGWSAPQIIQSGVQGLAFYDPALLAVPGFNPLLVWAQRDTGNQDSVSYLCCAATAADGSAWGSVASIPALPLMVESHVTAVISGGRPAFAMGGTGQGSGLFFSRAEDFQGVDWTAQPSALDTSGWCGSYASMALVNGLPAVAYFDTARTAIKYVAALDANGASWGQPQIVTSGGYPGPQLALAVMPNNVPLVVYKGALSEIKASAFY